MVFLPFGAELSKIDIDWLPLKSQLQQWIGKINNSLIDTMISALGSFAGSLINFIVALVFSIYLLANKEKLKQQIFLPLMFFYERLRINEN